MNYSKKEQNFHLKKAYGIVVADLKKSVGKKCKSYSVGCFSCACHRLAEDLKNIFSIIKER